VRRHWLQAKTKCQWGLQQLCKSCRTCFKFYCILVHLWSLLYSNNAFWDRDEGVRFWGLKGQSSRSRSSSRLMAEAYTYTVTYLLSRIEFGVVSLLDDLSVRLIEYSKSYISRTSCCERSELQTRNTRRLVSQACCVIGYSQCGKH